MDTTPAAAKAASVFTPGPATPAAATSGATGGASWILVIVAIVVMIGFIAALGYLVYDYFTYKKEAKAAAEQDRKTALARDRYIIDKTNVVSGTLNSNVLDVNSKADYLRAGFNSWSDDFSKALRFTSNMPVASAGAAASGAAAGAGAATGSFRIGQVPGAPIANLELLKHTSFVGGLTARELTSERSAALCGSGANSGRCIRFPDANGNTYLTGLTPEASVVLDAAKTSVLGSLEFGAAGSISNSEGGLLLNGDTVAIGKYDITGANNSGEMNMIMADNDSGMMYGSRRANEDFDYNKVIKFMTTRDGTVIMNGKGIVLTSNMEPYAMIGYDAEQKAVAIQAGPNGKIIVKGDVIMADDKAVFGTIGREYGKGGVPSGLRVSSVANNRLVFDTDVYLTDGRSLYGKVAGDGAVAAPLPTPAPAPTNPAVLPYYTLLTALKVMLAANRAEFTALYSLPEEIFNYREKLPEFFAKYPFMDAVYKIIAYMGTAEFAALPEADTVAAQEAVNYWTAPEFGIEFPSGRVHIGTLLQQSSTQQLYLNNRDFFNARYGYPLVGR